MADGTKPENTRQIGAAHPVVGVCDLSIACVRQDSAGVRLLHALVFGPQDQYELTYDRLAPYHSLPLAWGHSCIASTHATKDLERIVSGPSRIAWVRLDRC